MSLNEAQAAFASTARIAQGADVKPASRRPWRDARPTALAGLAISGFAVLLSSALPGGGEQIALVACGLFCGVAAMLMGRLVPTPSAAASGSVDHGAEGASLVAAFTGDAVTLHEGNGDVLFAGGALQTTLGALPHELQGAGLFGRIHVADRPLFLTTLARALGGGGASAEVRVKRQAMSGEIAFAWTQMRAHPRGLRQAVCSFACADGRKQAEDALEALRDASTDRKLSRLLARAADQLAMETQAAHRSLALAGPDHPSWRRARDEGLELLDRCRSDAVRLRAVLDDAGGTIDRHGGGMTIDAMVERCCEDVAAAAGACQRVDRHCDPLLACVVWPAGVSSAVVRLALCEALAEADGREAVRLSASREGDDCVVRIAFKPRGRGTMRPDAGDPRDLWRAIAGQLLLPTGGSMRRERCGGDSERLILRLPTAGTGAERVVELDGWAAPVDPRRLARAAG